MCRMRPKVDFLCLLFKKKNCFLFERVIFNIIFFNSVLFVEHKVVKLVLSAINDAYESSEFTI